MNRTNEDQGGAQKEVVIFLAYESYITFLINQYAVWVVRPWDNLNIYLCNNEKVDTYSNLISPLLSNIVGS